MKFAYIDESGSTDEGDVFVMSGLLVDAYRLRAQTKTFDDILGEFLRKHPSAPKELKTKKFIMGKNRWSKVPHDERKEFLKEMCELAAQVADIYGFAMSFSAFRESCCVAEYELPIKHYWPLSGMFLCSLIQKNAKKMDKNKGLTVLIFDDNKRHMPEVSDQLYQTDSWFDALYKTSKKIRGKQQWKEIKSSERFDHIINTAFAIKSEHSSLIQVADAICYVYRRWLELFSEKEQYVGEKDFYQSLVEILDKKRKYIGRPPRASCVSFYTAIKHPNWKL